MKALTRRRLYDTGAAVLALLVMWGLVSAEDAEQYLRALDPLLGVVLLILARAHVTIPTDDGDGEG